MVLVDELDDAAERFESEHGLVAISGGRHEELGTANAIIPLLESYIELIAVIDVTVAAENPVGTFLLQRLAAGGQGSVAVCLRTTDPAAVAERTGSRSVPMQRARPDGRELQWEVLGMEGAIVHGLPFFITWELDADHPARTPAEHPSRPLGIAWVEVGGVPSRVRSWVGSDGSHLRFVGGEPGVRRFAIAAPGGEIILS